MPCTNARSIGDATCRRGTTPAPHNLCPATLSGSPTDLLAWLFNPIFQTLFLGLVIFYKFTGDIGIAIVLLTLVIKTILVPLFRAQIVSQRRMQMLQPEIKALQLKFKGNRTKVNEETMRLYRERGVNPASGCLPSVLQLFLLLPIYQVFYTGLAAPNIDSALQFLGVPAQGLIQCQATGPCLDPTIHWLGNLAAQHPGDPLHHPVHRLRRQRAGASSRHCCNSSRRAWRRPARAIHSGHLAAAHCFSCL